MAGASKATKSKHKKDLAAIFPTSKLCKLRFEYSTPGGSVDKQDDQRIYVDQLEKEDRLEKIKHGLDKTTQLLLQDVNTGVVIVKNTETIFSKQGKKWMEELKELIHNTNKIYSKVLEIGLFSDKILQDMMSEYRGLKASCHLSQDKQRLLVTSSDEGEITTIRRFIESKMSEIRAGETRKLSIQPKHSSARLEVHEDKFPTSDTGPQNLNSVSRVTADWPEKGELPSAAKADHSHCTLSVPRNLMEGTGEETLGKTSCEAQFICKEDFPGSRAEPADLQTVTTNTMKTTGNTGNDGKEDATPRQLDSKQMDGLLSELEALQYLAGGNFAEVTILNEKERTMKIRILSQRQTLLLEDVSVRDAEWGEVWKIIRNPPKETKTFMKPLLSQDKLAVFSFDQESIMKVMRVIRDAIRESRPVIASRTDGPCRPEAAAGEEGQFCTSSGIEVYVYKTDITKLVVDAIVNAANGRLMHGGGVAAAISRAAGPELDEEGTKFVDKFGPLEVTDVLLTTSGNLPCKMVLHAVGPCWYDYKDKDKCTRDLQMTVVNCLIKAHSLKLNSIAVSSISSAIFGVPEALCAEMYMNAVHEFERQYGGKTSLRNIHFVDVRDLMVGIIQRTFRRMWKSDTLSDSSEKKTSQHIRREWGNNSSEDTSALKGRGNKSQETRSSEQSNDIQDTSSWQHSKSSQDSSRLVRSEDTQNKSRNTLDTNRQSHNKHIQDVSRERYPKDIQDSSKLEYNRNTYTQDTRSGYNNDTRDTSNQEHVREKQEYDTENQELLGSKKHESQTSAHATSRQNGRKDTSQTKGSGQGPAGRGRSGKGRSQKSGSISEHGKAAWK